jgi:glycosyltransferase involved in cell wall biosynthesis
MKEVSVVIPAFNESRIIGRNIRTLDGFLKENFRPYEIVVSEDGSTDGTDRILHSLSQTNHNITHLHSKERLGKGRALNKALLASSGRSIFMMDADFPVGLECIIRMVGYLERKDIVIGSRMMKRSVIRRSLSRSLASLFYNTLVRLLFHTGVRDHQCGVKAFRREVLSEILPHMRSNNFFWDTEFLVNAKGCGYRILEVPIEWKDRGSGKSKVSVPRDGLEMARNLLNFWYAKNSGKRL